MNCPETEHWQSLLAGGLSPEEEARCEEHLESCPTCCQRLDHDGQTEVLISLARQIGDPTVRPPDQALRQAQENLRGTHCHASPPLLCDLYFLRPSNRPGILGTLGEYDVLEVIGQGGFGIVLEAYEPALHRLVAIKVLSPAMAGSPTARKRFTREAQAAAAIAHDHVVTVHAVQELEGVPYLVMQYVPGESLQARLDREGPLEVLNVVRIGMQTAAGLAAAHAQGLIHRDIKPANLLLENGLARVKITDFGLARTASDVGLTLSGVVAGTPEYMSPEQASEGTVDHRCDLFSLGCVMYAMCTGRPPFRGSTVMAVLRQVSDHDPPPLRAVNPEVPVWLDEFIQRLLAKDPARRIQEAAEAAALLEGYLAHLRQPITAPVPKLPARQRGPIMPRFPRPSWKFVAVAAVFLVAVGAVFGTFLSRGEATSPKGQQEYSHDLCNGEGLERLGPDADQCVHFEPEGLRITLPTDYSGPPGFHGERPSTGVLVPVAIGGDFDILVTFEILNEPRREDAGFPHTRISLDLAVDRDTNIATMLSHRMSKWNGARYMAWVHYWDEAAGKPAGKYQDFPAQSKLGRLRIVREGEMLSFHAADGPEEPLVLLRQYPFSADEIEDVRLTASTGGPKAALDVRLRDLRIRAQRLRGADVTRADPPARTGLLALGMVGILLAAVVAGIVVARQKGRTVAPAPQTSPTPVPPPESFAFPCPHCGARLKARAALIGKQVKCPGCTQAVQVQPGEV